MKLVIIASVIPKVIVCAKLVNSSALLPEIDAEKIDASSIGQHHWPTSAGIDMANVVIAIHNVLRFSFDADAKSGLRDFSLSPTVASASPHSTQSSGGT